MMLSMTGYGAAQAQGEGLSCAVEIRAVNNRFLKFSIRLPDTHYALESRVEKLIRETIRRGTVQAQVRLDRASGTLAQRLNLAALQAYIEQLRSVAPIDGALVGHLLTLPGVVEEAPLCVDAENDWPLIESALRMAIDDLQRMRRDEGSAMRQELFHCCQAIAGMVADIEEAAPEMVRRHRDRLRERVQALLGEEVALAPSDLMREVAIIADRTDIAEELTRLRSHLAQFDDIVHRQEGAGRALEFLVQEMHREANTIGSKASDIAISQLVVELKSRVERIREVIQNVE